MAITKRTAIDKKEILADGTIQVRTAQYIEEDGVVISKSFVNRQIYRPGEDVSNAPTDVRRIATIEHTAERITAETARKAAEVAKLEAENT
jgi:hypothetical protein